MPIYEYECKSCGNRFEKLVFASDTEEIKCPACKAGETRRLISSVSISGGNSESGCGPAGSRGGFS